MSFEDNAARNEGAPPYGASAPGSAYTGGPTTPPPYPPPPPPSGAPNPGLAALLGCIPGVGAMYNGQFAKGIAHLAIFAVLVSLSDSHSVFGLFVMGWVVYQVFDAHQTARARRDGQPLPNPFGLNDIGERMGFGKGWSQSPSNPGTSVPPNAPPAGANWNWQQSWQDLQQDVQQTWHQQGGYQPWTSTQQPGPQQPPPAAGAAGYPPYTPPPPPSGYVPPVGYGAYGVPPIPPVPPVGGPTPRSTTFPAGAIWLIGLGIVLLLTQTHILPGFRPNLLWPFIFIGLGIWSFLQRSGFGILQNDGSAAYRWNLLRAIRRSGILILLGVLGLIGQLHWIRWEALWPFILIYFGLFTIAERTAANQMAAEAYMRNYPPAAAPTEEPSPYETSTATTTSIVPTSQHGPNDEGR